MVTVKYIRGGQIKKMSQKYADILVKLKLVEYHTPAVAPAAPPVYSTKPMKAETAAKPKKKSEKKKKEKSDAPPKEKKPKASKKPEEPTPEEKGEYKTKVMVAEGK